MKDNRKVDVLLNGLAKMLQLSLKHLVSSQ